MAQVGERGKGADEEMKVSASLCPSSSVSPRTTAQDPELQVVTNLDMSLSEEFSNFSLLFIYPSDNSSHDKYNQNNSNHHHYYNNINNHGNATTTTRSISSRAYGECNNEHIRKDESAALAFIRPTSTSSGEPHSSLAPSFSQAWERARSHSSRRQWYYITCFLAGWIGGLTCLFLVPVDLIKCRIQIGAYTSLREGFQEIFRVEANRSCIMAFSLFFRGWVPTAIGSTAHSSFRLLMYEFLKSIWLPDPVQRSWEKEYAKRIADLCSISVGEASNLFFSAPSRWIQVRTFFFAAFVSEFLAVILLVPWETLKVSVQTKSLSTVEDGEKGGRACVTSTIAAAHSMWQHRGGLGGFYRGLPWLWLRQIPYTIAKFFFFEIISGWLTSLYGFLLTSGLRGSREEEASSYPHPWTADLQVNTAKPTATPLVQLCIALLAGLVAGMLSAIVSHPPDTLLSKRTHNASSSSYSSSSHVSMLGHSFGSGPSTKNDPGKRGTVGEWIRRTGKDFVEAWKGLGPRMLMIGILSAMQWTTYSVVKLLCGFPPFEDSKKT